MKAIYNFLLLDGQRQVQVLPTKKTRKEDKRKYRSPNQLANTDFLHYMNFLDFESLFRQEGNIKSTFRAVSNSPTAGDLAAGFVLGDRLLFRRPQAFNEK